MGGEWAWLLAVFAGVYAVIFYGVSLKYPAVPLALILGLAPFQNDISGLGGLHFSLSEVHLLLSVPLVVFQRGPIRFGWMSGFLGGALLLTGLIALPSWRDSSLLSLVQMILYWGVAVVVCANLPRRPGDLVLAWNTLIAVGLVFSLTACITRSSYFFGLNKNGIGASLACALTVAVERWQTDTRARRWVYPSILLLLSAALILVLSRGAWLAAFSGVVMLFFWRAQYARLFKVACASVPIILVAWMMLPSESREYALGVDDSRYNIHARTLNSQFALEQWQASPALGVGVGLRKEYDATNVLILTLAESGPAGLCAFLAVHARLLAGVWARRRRWPSGAIQSSAVVLAGALVFGKLVHGMVDHYWSRGAIMIVWGSVGMAVSMDRWRAWCARGSLQGQAKIRRMKRWPGAPHPIC